MIQATDTGSTNQFVLEMMCRIRSPFLEINRICRVAECWPSQGCQHWLHIECGWRLLQQFSASISDSISYGSLCPPKCGVVRLFGTTSLHRFDWRVRPEVLKVIRQTAGGSISYHEAVKELLQRDGIRGLQRSSS